MRMEIKILRPVTKGRLCDYTYLSVKSYTFTWGISLGDGRTAIAELSAVCK